MSIAHRHQLLGSAFSPNSPINTKQLFCGRMEQLRRVLQVTEDSSVHAVLFGERGVGKTSLANVMPQCMPLNICVRVAAESGDGLISLMNKIGKRIVIKERQQAGLLIPKITETQLPLEFPPNSDVDAIVQILSSLPDRCLLIFDEYDRIPPDSSTRKQMAEVIKGLSDASAKATILIVGVANDVSSLIGEHPSLDRCLRQIRMQRMSSEELVEIIDRGLTMLHMTMVSHIKDGIVRASAGFPHFTHLLAKHAANIALNNGEIIIDEDHFVLALESAVEDAHESLRQAYQTAKLATRPTHFRDVLFACALVDEDDAGTFPASALAPILEDILHNPLRIAQFGYHLGKLCELERGPILNKLGTPNRHRYSFVNPLMKPYLRLEYERYVLRDEEDIGTNDVDEDPE